DLPVVTNIRMLLGWIWSDDNMSRFMFVFKGEKRMCNETLPIEDPRGACIHRVPVFQNLTQDETQLLSTVIQSNRYEKGQFVFREGDKSNCLFVLHKGLIKITIVSDLGKEHIVLFLWPGDFFGQSALLQEKSHYANAE